MGPLSRPPYFQANRNVGSRSSISKSNRRRIGANRRAYRSLLTSIRGSGATRQALPFAGIQVEPSE